MRMDNKIPQTKMPVLRSKHGIQSREKMILDATAANRTMWKTKNTENIIYIDLEKKLKQKPTIFADNTNTPFLSSSFDTIFYDPPHDIGKDDSDLLTMGKLQLKEAKATEHRLHTYYGLYYIKTVNDMIKHVYKAQKEFHRILKHDGLVWLKWCEVKMKLTRILRIWTDWNVLIIINCTDPTHTMGKQQTYWICLTKKKREIVQTTLL